MWSSFFVLSKFPWIWNIYVKISFLLNKAKNCRIQFPFSSLVILKAQKSQPHFGNTKYFVTINSRILLLKFGLRINAVKYFKDQRRHSCRHGTVMFRRTLSCSISKISQTALTKSCDSLFPKYRVSMAYFAASINT